jgi:hypothetical protein
MAVIGITKPNAMNPMITAPPMNCILRFVLVTDFLLSTLPDFFVMVLPWLDGRQDFIGLTSH